MTFDLHVHSHLSYDSFASFPTIIRTAVAKGLGGIAITDHEVLASANLPELAAKSNLWLIRGIEVKTEIGDILGLFLSKSLKHRDAEGLIEEIHEQEGIAVLAHPFKYARHLDQYPSRILEKLDGVEMINSRWIDLGHYAHSRRIADLLTAVNGRTAGSDAHFPFELGRALWQADVTTPHELKDSIRHNTGRAIAVSFSTAWDTASQCVKLAKNPSFTQLARLVYRTSRKVVTRPHGVFE